MDQAAVVVDRRVLRERVDEAPLGEHPRRRGRHEHVADEPDQVRDDQPVPEAGEALVVLEVHPQERDTDDRELREPVRVRGERDEDRGRVDDTLDGRLEERTQVVLGAEDGLAVLEGVRDAAVHGQPVDVLTASLPGPPVLLKS